MGSHAPNPALTDDDPVVDEHGAGEMSAFKHAVLTIAIVLSGFVIAYFVDDLQMGEPLVKLWILRELNRAAVLSFVGSTGSTTVSFILPGLFFWKLTRNDSGTSKMLNRTALALAIYGVLVVVFW